MPASLPNTSQLINRLIFRTDLINWLDVYMYDFQVWGTGFFWDSLDFQTEMNSTSITCKYDENTEFYQSTKIYDFQLFQTYTTQWLITQLDDHFLLVHKIATFTDQTKFERVLVLLALMSNSAWYWFGEQTKYLSRFIEHQIYEFVLDGHE